MFLAGKAWMNKMKYFGSLYNYSWSLRVLNYNKLHYHLLSSMPVGIVITHFWVISQFTFFSLLKKYKKIKDIIKKYNSEKRMPERSTNGQKWVKEVQKYEDWNLTVFCWLMRALLTKKIQFEEEKSKIRCLWVQLNFIEGLIKFIESLIAR